MRAAAFGFALLLTAVGGCEARPGDPSAAASSSPPDKIELSYSSLQLEELAPEVPRQGWNLIRTVPFGQIQEQEASLTIYQEREAESLLPARIDGVLNLKNQHYVIRDLSGDWLQEDVSSAYRLIDREIPGQKRYELISSVEKFANGPGLRELLVFDEKLDRLRSFDCWGQPVFADLDSDGNDELLIEFEGLHLSWPDLQFIRSEADGLVQSASVVDSFGRTEGEYARLNRERISPTIEISNVKSEDEPIHTYRYESDALIREEG